MNCSICGYDKFWQIPFAKDELTIKLLREQDLDSRYQWYLCRQCGNGFQSVESNRGVLRKIWEANRLLDDHGPEQQAKIKNIRVQGARKSAIRAHKIYKSILKKNNGSILDVGCGLGELVKVFQDHGWESFGVDPDPSTKEFHKKLGINTITSQIEDVNLEKVYDAVFTTHSIYFVSHPVDFLKSLKRFIAPDGYLCVAIADFFASDDAGLPGYVHTFFPSGQSMKYILALAGYRTIFIKRARGSIYMAAQPDDQVLPEKINTLVTYWLFRTKRIRYLLIGLPTTLLRKTAASIVGHFLKQG